MQKNKLSKAKNNIVKKQKKRYNYLQNRNSNWGDLRDRKIDQKKQNI